MRHKELRTTGAQPVARSLLTGATRQAHFKQELVFSYSESWCRSGVLLSVVGNIFQYLFRGKVKAIKRLILR